MRFVAIVVTLVALGLIVDQQVQRESQQTDSVDTYRMPATNPPLDPERPDLIGEPRIEEE